MGEQEKNKKSGYYIFFAIIFIFLAIIMCTSLNNNYTTQNNETEQVTQDVISDTILIANDSVMDRLKVNYGLQVMEYGYRKVNYTDTGGYGTDFFIKFKNLRGTTLDNSYKLYYKAIDSKTNEVLESNYTYLTFNKISPNEVVQLEPYINWTHTAGEKYILYLWIEDIPMRPIEVIFYR